MMGVTVGKIRTARPSHTLYPIADGLDEINVYCRRYHHAENPHAANEAIDDAELQGVCTAHALPDRQPGLAHPSPQWCWALRAGSRGKVLERKGICQRVPNGSRILGGVLD